MFGICCFCKQPLVGYGNSTWPIYYKAAGEQFRCCDECNTKYVIKSRLDPSKIMDIRAKMGIIYEGETLVKSSLD